MVHDQPGKIYAKSWGCRVTAPLLDNTDLFFARQWQALADDIEQCPERSGTTEQLRNEALAKAEYYRARIKEAANR